MHDAVAGGRGRLPDQDVAPCEGTGYEIGSMSIIKGARNLDNAKKFYDWALTPNSQSKAQEVKSFQVPSNKNAKTSPQGAGPGRSS
jgi:iron(III) transport system substrate-binding protein